MADIVRAIRDAQSKSCEQSQVVLDNDELLVAWDPPIVFKNRALVQIIIKQNVRAVTNKQRIIRVTDGVSDDEILRALASSSPVGLPSVAYNTMHREFHPVTCKKCSSVLSKEEYQAHVTACAFNDLRPKSAQKSLKRKQKLDATAGNDDFAQSAPTQLFTSHAAENLSTSAERNGRSMQDDAQSRPKKKRARASNNNKCRPKSTFLKAVQKVVKKQKRKLCSTTGCQKRPSFNQKGCLSAARCGTHRIPGDVDVVSRRCNFLGCDSQPTFGEDGSKKALWCKIHKQPGNVDVANKPCGFASCDSQPTFGIKGTKKALFCRIHKAPEHVDVKSKRCAAEGCDRRPSYNAAGTKKGLFCVTHKYPEHVRVVGTPCAAVGCKSFAKYNAPGTKRGLYCSDHKEPHHVDVTYNRCAEPGCETHPRYGFPNHPRSHCAVHKQAGQVIFTKRQCESCTSLAIFGITNAERCEVHIKEGDVDFLQRKCKSCGLVELLDQNGLCGFCDPAVVRRMRLRKQREIRAVLMEANLPIFDTYDQVLENGACGKQRPDFTWSCGVVLEVDESQHLIGRYNEDCERIRMINLTGTMGVPTLFIRFNPDEYHGWKSGMRARERHDYLVQFLRQQLREPQLETRVVRLFFDGFMGTPEFEPLDVLQAVHASS